MLGHKEKVIPVSFGHRVVQDCPGWRVVQFLASLNEDPCVDSLLNHDEAETRIVLVTDVLEAAPELISFVTSRQGQLTVPHTIPEDDHLVGPDVVGVVELLQSLDKCYLETINKLLTRILEDCGTEPFAHGHVGATDNTGDAGTTS